MDAMEDSVKQQVFAEIIESVLAYDAARGNPPFNFADAEWVAIEAKNRGCLSSEHDVHLLVATITGMTQVDEATCWDEIPPVLAYPLALDTPSSEKLQALIKAEGRGKVAQQIGIASATLEKLETGGRRGPIFKHRGVSEKTITRVRSFLKGRQS